MVAERFRTFERAIKARRNHKKSHKDRKLSKEKNHGVHMESGPLEPCHTKAIQLFLARKYGIRLHKIELMHWENNQVTEMMHDMPVGNTTWGKLTPILENIYNNAEVILPSEEVMTHDMTRWRASKHSDLRRNRNAWGKIISRDFFE